MIKVYYKGNKIMGIFENCDTTSPTFQAMKNTTDINIINTLTPIPEPIEPQEKTIQVKDINGDTYKVKIYEAS